MNNITQKDLRTALEFIGFDTSRIDTDITISISNYPIAEGLLLKNKNIDYISISDSSIVVSATYDGYSEHQLCVDSTTTFEDNPAVCVVTTVNDSKLGKIYLTVPTINKYNQLLDSRV